jgi:hypothetical protein
VVGDLERLGRRIDQLDRWRRPLAIVFAVAILAGFYYGDWLPADWPRAHLAMTSVVLGAICWYGIEVLLGFVIAVWETDYSKLTDPPGLPRAEVLRRRK